MIHYSREFRPTDTKCPRCKVEMSEGLAIQCGPAGENVCVGFGRPRVNHENLKLIECLKCPRCGHSDDLI